MLSFDILTFSSIIVSFCFQNANCAHVGSCELDQCYPKSVCLEDQSGFDFIIVGAGSAGCTLANRLTENGTYSVLLIDAGGDPPLESVIPGLAGTLQKSAVDWNYTTTNDHFSSQSIRNGQLPMSQGKMLGGSSSMGFMFWFRGSYKDYDDWCEQGADGWCYNDLIPYFKRAENKTTENLSQNIDYQRYRGTAGPLKVSQIQNYVNVTNLLIESFQEMGVPYNTDVNSESQMGTTIPDFNIYASERQSTVKAYVSPIIQRSNLYVLKNSLVTKILLNPNTKTAVGVEYLTNDRNVKRVFAVREVILSAGSINTPKLLMLSGIGPKKTLNKLGIKCLRNLPVGKFFQDHPTIPIVYSINKNLEPNKQVDPSISEELYFQNKTGNYAYSPAVSLVSFVSLADNDYSDYQIHHLYSAKNGSAALATLESWNFHPDILNQITAMNNERDLIVQSIVLTAPNSRGKVTLSSSSPFGKPIIKTGFFSDKSDLDTITQAILSSVKIVDTDAFTEYGARVEYFTIPQCNSFELGTENYWRCYALSMAISLYHPSCTARMGGYYDCDAVVDPELKVKSVKRLRIVDASIMPTLTRCNTNNPTIMIAEKAADLIKHDSSTD